MGIPRRRILKAAARLFLAILTSVLAVSCLPASGIAAAPLTALSFTSAATVTPPSGVPGSSFQITATVTSQTATTALIDVEVYGPGGSRVYQQVYDNQSFASGQQRAYAVNWQAQLTAGPGQYLVKIGIFSPGWTSLYDWNDGATSISLAAPVATSTATTPAPLTTTATPTATATIIQPPPPVGTSTITPPATTPEPTGGPKLYGVSVAGAEFGESRLPGINGRDYLYAADANRHQYFASKGLSLIRVPFRWERVQRQAYGPLSPDDVAGLRAMLNAAQSAGQFVILDMHNYARYYERPLNRSDAAMFSNVWARLAREFTGHPALFGYEVMNEPHDLPEGTDAWAYLAQVATDAIRTYDHAAWVLVPGYGWQTARSWPEQNPTLNVRDEPGRILYAAHQYFDSDLSGRYSRSYDAEGAYPSVGTDHLQPFLNWLAGRNARGIVTEYGIPDGDERWRTVLDLFLAALDADPRIVGGVYWASGPWWGSYPLSVEPTSSGDRPQMAILARHPSRP
jgi:endoglucanase